MLGRIVLICSLLITLNSTLVIAQKKMKHKAPTLNHIALYVFDLNASTTFYKNIIGLNLIPEPFKDGKHSWFTIGKNIQLHLIEGAMGIKQHEKSTHICFSVSSVENFTRQLQKENIGYENVKGDKNTITARPDGVKQIYFTDPDGYWIEINDAH